jgi:hypothetical protein
MSKMNQSKVRQINRSNAVVLKRGMFVLLDSPFYQNRSDKSIKTLVEYAEQG